VAQPEDPFFVLVWALERRKIGEKARFSPQR